MEVRARPTVRSCAITGVDNGMQEEEHGENGEEEGSGGNRMGREMGREMGKSDGEKRWARDGQIDI